MPDKVRQIKKDFIKLPAGPGSAQPGKPEGDKITTWGCPSSFMSGRYRFTDSCCIYFWLTIVGKVESKARPSLGLGLAVLLIFD